MAFFVNLLMKQKVYKISKAIEIVDLVISLASYDRLLAQK